MKVLFIGGTRLLGKKIVETFLEKKEAEIIVISRRSDVFDKTLCRYINKDRNEAIREIEGEYFDYVFDFISYNIADIKNLVSAVRVGHYVFISTCWITKLNNRFAPDEFFTEADPALVETLLPITKEYLLNKQASELYLKEQGGDINYTILRLPIFLGNNDHTKRLDFYISRFNDGYPVIAVNGGNNICQVAYINDLSVVIVDMFSRNLFKNHQLVEGLPTEKHTVKKILNLIKTITGSVSAITDIDSDYLEKYLPQYLTEEPFWREKEMVLTGNNIFAITQQHSTPIEIWFKEINDSIYDPVSSSIRKKEIELIKN